MSMLERTTAGLEPSRLKHLLPRVTKAASANFSCTLRPQARRQKNVSVAESARTEAVNASDVLLDFLYPRGAVAFINKSSTSTTSRRPSISLLHRKPGQHDARLYATSTTDAVPRANPAFDFPASGNSTTRSLPLRGDEDSPDAELARLLSINVDQRDSGTYEQVWEQFRKIKDGESKKDLELTVLLYLSSSRQYADAERLIRIYRRLPLSRKNTAATAAAISAHLIVGDNSKALDLFRESTTSEAWSDTAPPGLDALVAHSLKTFTWEFAADAWRIYSAKTGLKKIRIDAMTAVSKLPYLRDRLQAFSRYVDGYANQVGRPANGEEIDEHLDIMDQVFKAVLEAAIDHVDPHTTYPMVSAMKNPRVFENFVRAAAARAGNKELALKAFAEYRAMDSYSPNPRTLALMVRHYYPDNVRGMEDVLKDWLNAKGSLNHWGYQKYLAFYASRGDVKAVYRMWDEYTRLYPYVIKSDEDTFAHLLHVHAVRGDLARFEQVFSEISGKYKVKPNTVCWNIRLHLYVERGNYAHAMEVFEGLCSAVEPDAYSFSTIMAMVGGRGDLGLASDLYWLAQECGVEITESIIDPIVEAYCQNERFDEAERLCVVTTREGKVKGAPYTSLWNTLVFQYALRHDLVAVNRILKLMTKLNVAYNSDTYSGLLFALAQCRQPRRAVELLRAAQEDGIFTPTAEHYTLLMMAYVRSKQPHRALQVNRLMHHMGFHRSSRQVQMVIKAFSQWQEFPKGEQAYGSGVTSNERRELFAKALREFQRSLTEGSRSMRSQQSLGREAVRMHLGAVRRFSFIIFMLVQARDFAGVDEVMQLYKSIAPPDEQEQPMPLKLCNAIMLSDFYEGRHDLVKKMWKTILQRAQEVGRPQTLQETRLESILGHSKSEASKKAGNSALDGRNIEQDLRTALSADASFGADADELSQTPYKKREPEHKIVAKMRYGLTDPLKVMQRVYTTERNPDALVSLINKDILASGFLLDSKNWNHYVQNLARLGRVRDALDICENRLMGQWSGFASLQSHRQGWDGTSPQNGDHNPRDRSMPAITGGRGGSVTSTMAEAISGVGLGGIPGGNLSGASSSKAANTRLSRAQQLRETATRYNRPMTFTFMVLAKAYLELEQAAMWSSQAEREFKDLAIKYPSSVNAVRTMVRMNSRIEGRVFGGSDEV